MVKSKYELWEGDTDGVFDYVWKLLTAGSKGVEMDDLHFFPTLLPACEPWNMVRTFVKRYNTKELLCPYSYEEYLRNGKLQSSIQGMQLDRDAFWMLTLFCHDYACDVCLNGCAKKERWENQVNAFLDTATTTLGENEEGAKVSEDVAMAIRWKGKTLTVDDERAVYALTTLMKEGMKTLGKNVLLKMVAENVATGTTTSTKAYAKQESDSVMIWLFARLMAAFFKLLPPQKNRGKKYDGVSLSRMLLVSRMVYYTRLNKNPNLVYDDETLKGYMNQYKCKQLKTGSSIYNPVFYSMPYIHLQSIGYQTNTGGGKNL